MVSYVIKEIHFATFAFFANEKIKKLYLSLFKIIVKELGDFKISIGN